MQKLKLKTKDLTDSNIEAVAKLFPNVITEKEDEEGNLIKAIDFDLLRQILSKELAEDDMERYRLDWPGKKASLLKANTPITKTLRPKREDSVNFDTTENLYIEGDNLEALKILQESYLNKVKMIYIDPPYNTGKDFIYRDNRAVSKEEYEEQIGVEDEEGGKLFKNTDTNGRFHSDWLSMMYERLIIARDFLRDDGVIFISIDDNEVHNLRKICDEIFGEENFVGGFVKQSKVGGGSDSRHIVKEHEYLLAYARNINTLSEFYTKHDSEYLKRYKEEDESGKFFWDTFARPGLKNPINYDVEAPDGNIINGDWIRSKERFKTDLKNGEIKFLKKERGEWSVQFKQRLNVEGKKPRSMTSDFGGTIEGKNELVDLFGSDKIFSYPKSAKFVKTFLSFVNSDDHEIILDFFSGSATTAHAVMKLNAEDGGNRKFIMVQLPELTDEKSEAYKVGYENICEIGKERIRRAGKKIVEDELKSIDDELAKLEQEIEKSKSTLLDDGKKEELESKRKELLERKEKVKNLDIGFRVYKVDSTNMKDVYYHPSELRQETLDTLITNVKEDRSDEDLLTQVILDLGLELTLPIEIKEMSGNKVFFVQGNSLVACFDRELNFDIVDKLAKIEPLKVVFKDSSFKDDKDRINLENRFKRLSPNTQVTVI